MQSPTPHSWSDLIYFLAGTLTGLIPHLITGYRNYKKADIEDREVTARAVLAEASASSLRIRDELATGEYVEKALATMMSASDKIREQQAQIFDLQQEKIELIMRREEVRRMKALLDLNNIPYSDADKFRMK